MTISLRAARRILAIQIVQDKLICLWRLVRVDPLLPASVFLIYLLHKVQTNIIGKELNGMVVSVGYRFWLVAIAFSCLVTTMALAQSHSVKIDKEMAELLEDKKYAEVEALVLKSGKTDPFFLAWLRLKQGKKQEGLQLLKQQVAAATDNRVELVLRSLALLSDVSVKDAIDLGDFYLKNEPFKNNPRLKLYLANLYLKQKEVKPAETLINEVLETSFAGPDLKKGLFNLIVYFYENGHNDDALVYFDKLMAKVPDTQLSPGDQLLWARIKAAAGKPLEALKKIDMIQSTFPDYYETKKGMFCLSRGIAYEKLGDRKQAKKEWLAVVELAKEDPKYQGMVPIAKDKLTEYKQDEETIRKMKEAAANAEVPPDAVPTDIHSNAASTRRLTLIVTSILLVICVTALIVRRRYRK